MRQTDTPDVSTSLAGIRMRSPIGVGAIGAPMVSPLRLTPEMHADVLLRHIEAGSGFVVLPLSTSVPDELLRALEEKAKPFGHSWDFCGPRYMRTELPGPRSEGLYVRTGFGIPPIMHAQRFTSDTAKIIDLLKRKRVDGVPIIANVIGLGAYPETFATTAKAHEEAGVDLIELDLSCAVPVGLDEAVDSYFEKDFPLFPAGFLLGDQPELLDAIVREVVRTVKIPVGVKLSPETGFPRVIELARRARDSGARFVNCGNLAMTIVPPDIYNHGKPKWPFVDGNPFVAIGGGWLRPIVRKHVAAIARFVPGLEIVATGGLVDPEQIIEAMMLGANGAQVVTGVLYHGRNLIRRDIEFLTRYMRAQGYVSVKDFIGLGQEYIKAENAIKSEHQRLYASVDGAKCTGCGLCTQHVCLASHMEDGIARVIIRDCAGCGMCVALCPEGAVTLKAEA